jgi:hypothetical protein
MKKNEYHPFFCFKKNCRTTAWDTPEYLDAEAWELVRVAIEALETNDKKKFDDNLYKLNWTKAESKSEVFFNRALGWPEGKTYYAQAQTEFYFAMIQKKDLPKLKEAYANRPQ